MLARYCLAAAAVWCARALADSGCARSAEKPLETRVRDASIVFRAVVVENRIQSRTLDLALVSVYQGGSELAAVSPYGGSPYNTTDRQVTLQVNPSLASCTAWGGGGAQAVVFARISEPAAEHVAPEGVWLEASDAPVPWTMGVDVAIWNSVGWGGWGEWGACSATCGGGAQLRRRACARAACEGFGAQRRACNEFRCEGAVNPLASSSRAQFHPSHSPWAPAPDRPRAYSLTPNSYIWIASSQLFRTDNALVHEQGFPREFTLFVTLRLRPESGGFGQGTLFSLRSRRRRDAYLSLELAGRGAARLVHAARDAVHALYLAVTLHDFRWHQIAISVHDDSTVRSYVDCRWLRTDVLKKDSLDTPKDADLIIGYLFSGDLDQLVIVPEADAASKQCSSTEVPIYEDDQQFQDSSFPYRRIDDNMHNIGISNRMSAT